MPCCYTRAAKMKQDPDAPPEETRHRAWKGRVHPEARGEKTSQIMTWSLTYVALALQKMQRTRASKLPSSIPYSGTVTEDAINPGRGVPRLRAVLDASTIAAIGVKRRRWQREI